MGVEEAEQGRGFVEWAAAGSVLERAIRRIGCDREQFVMWNVVPVQPPQNWLEGAPWEAEAVEWGRTYLEEVLEKYKPRAILALGNIATRATTGLAGDKLGVGSLTGFVLPSRYGPVVSCFHPSYLRRGAMSLFGVLMRCLKLAMVVAKEGRQAVMPPVDSPPPGYVLYPTEEQALEFAMEVQKHTTDNIEHRYLAYDIETPWSTSEESAEEAEGTQTIKSIQFSLGPESGIFMPWREPFLGIARRCLGTRLPKIGFNNYRFDDDIIRANGVSIDGEIHDVMWMHHHLQPDLPRGLQFVAAQNGWPWPWKHLANSAPEFYGVVDVAVLQFLVN